MRARGGAFSFPLDCVEEERERERERERDIYIYIYTLIQLLRFSFVCLLVYHISAYTYILLCGHILFFICNHRHTCIHTYIYIYIKFIYLSYICTLFYYVIVIHTVPCPTSRPDCIVAHPTQHIEHWLVRLCRVHTHFTRSRNSRLQEYIGCRAAPLSADKPQTPIFSFRLVDQFQDLPVHCRRAFHAPSRPHEASLGVRAGLLRFGPSPMQF